MPRAPITPDERAKRKRLQTNVNHGRRDLKAAVRAVLSVEQREVVAEVLRAKVRLLNEHAKEFGANKGTIKDPDAVVSAAIQEAQQPNDHDGYNDSSVVPRKAGDGDGDGGSDADIDGEEGALKPKAPAASQRRRHSAAAAPRASKGRGETPGKRQLSAASRASKAEYSDVDSSEPEARFNRSQSDGEKVALTLKSPAINAPPQRRRRSAAAAPSASNGRVAQLRGQTVTTPPMETPLIPPWSSVAESSGDSFHPEARCNRSSGDAQVGAAATSASNADMADADTATDKPATKRARLHAPACMYEEDPTSEEEALGHPCCNWTHVKAVQAEINTLFKYKRQECLEVCAKMGLSESAVKTGLLNHHFFMEGGSFVSFNSKHAHDLCTDALGGVMPFTLTRDKTFLFVSERWFTAFRAIDRKVKVNGVVPPEYSTILYQLHDLLKKQTLVNQLTRTRWISHDTLNLDSDSGGSGGSGGSGNAKAAVNLRDTRTKLPALHFKRLPVQLAEAGFTEEQADAASALWGWSGTINQDTVVLDGPWYTLKGSDLTRIAGTEWLNDVIMDAFLDVSLACPPASNVMAVPLATRGDQLLPWVRSYEGRLDCAAHLVIPLNDANRHWLVGVVDRQRNVLTLYDSCCSVKPLPDMELRERQVQHVHTVLSTIYRDHDPAAMSVVDPMRENPKKQQKNGSDCGVFVCANAWCHLNNQPFLTQKEAKFFRWYILHILCTRLKRINGAELV
ncbi:hypothetical protein JKP88DRAFT_244612 [Tribonema minus]|uniref:Ubiquitin-like protease family profile domain-containing protein n=1 Tax=Tribonema minus TaxID=303371 RepID=A0A836CFI2_9STRA|nr:hypothetical protein JKP88DRAFT_244612 [Tribonema minus]